MSSLRPHLGSWSIKGHEIFHWCTSHTARGDSSRLFITNPTANLIKKHTHAASFLVHSRKPPKRKWIPTTYIHLHYNSSLRLQREGLKVVYQGWNCAKFRYVRMYINRLSRLSRFYYINWNWQTGRWSDVQMVLDGILFNSWKSRLKFAALRVSFVHLRICDRSNWTFHFAPSVVSNWKWHHPCNKFCSEENISR